MRNAKVILILAYKCHIEHVKDLGRIWQQKRFTFDLNTIGNSFKDIVSLEYIKKVTGNNDVPT